MCPPCEALTQKLLFGSAVLVVLAASLLDIFESSGTTISVICSQSSNKHTELMYGLVMLVM